MIGECGGSWHVARVCGRLVVPKALFGPGGVARLDVALNFIFFYFQDVGLYLQVYAFFCLALI